MKLLEIKLYLGGALRAACLQAQNLTRLPSEKLLSSDIFLLAWIAGICCLLAFSQLPDLSVVLLLTFIATVLSLRIKWLLPLAVLALAASWATWNFSEQLRPVLTDATEGESIQLLGQVVGLPDVDQTRTRFEFRIENASQAGALPDRDLRLLHHQQVQLSCYLCPLSILPNQRWRFSVRLKRPHGYASWGAFDFEKFLFRQRIAARGYVRIKESNQLLATGGWSIDRFRWQIKNHLRRQSTTYPDGKAMIAALMIGDKSLLSERQRTTFQSTGVSHLMAISGLHVGLVFLAVAFLSKWMLMPVARIFDWQPRQRLVLLPALLAALSYSALAGFAVSTQRAFIMLSVFVICRLCARDVSLLRVLMMAAALILALDPCSILDVGFWLSCGAVLIIAIALQSNGDISLLRLQPLLWLGMIPLTTLFFGQVSIISPLVNLLMVPLFCLLLIPLVLISLVVLQLGLTAVHSWMLEYLGLVFDAVFAGLLWLHKLPFAVYYPPSVSNVQIASFAVAIFIYAVHWRIRHIVLAASLALFLLKAKHFADGEVWLALLDVGQGLSMVIEAQNYVLVYDVGPAYASGFNTADAVLIPYLRHRGISKIDLLIISHADNDHGGGYPMLQSAFKIDQVLTSRVDQIPDADSCRAGQSWWAGTIKFKILSPVVDTPPDSNNQSCVLSIDNGRFRALLTGDIEILAEQLLLADESLLKADFMLVPHHGSKTSSSQRFINATDPQLALLAAGYRNHYGHPHKQVVKRYRDNNIELASTIESGSILLKFNNNSWSREYFRVSEKGFWQGQKKPY